MSPTRTATRWSCSSRARRLPTNGRQAEFDTVPRRRMRRVAVLGAGAGGAAAVAELVAAGHEVRFWGRSAKTLAPFRQQGGIAHDGILGRAIARPHLITDDLPEATAAADALVVCVTGLAHADIAAALAAADVKNVPVVIIPGHTGGALEFRQA